MYRPQTGESNSKKKNSIVLLMASYIYVTLDLFVIMLFKSGKMSADVVDVFDFKKVIMLPDRQKLMLRYV